MGNALQAQNNMSGAIPFYNYATILNPLYQEAIQSLLLLKCKNMTQQAKQESPEEIIAKWVSLVCSLCRCTRQQRECVSKKKNCTSTSSFTSITN